MVWPPVVGNAPRDLAGVGFEAGAVERRAVEESLTPLYSDWETASAQIEELEALTENER